MRNSPLRAVRGEDALWEMTVTQGASAFNLTSATISFKAAYEVGASPEISCSIGDGITVTSASTGVFELEISGAKTAIAGIPASLDEVRLVYSLSVTKSSKTYYVASGDLVIYGRVS